MRKLMFIMLAVSLLSVTVISAQKGRYLQVDLGGGVSVPVLGFKTEEMFARRGYSATAGFDYFFGRLGLGFSGGYFTNPAKDAFSSYISKQYLEDVNFASMQQWTTGYAVFGPTLRLGGSRLNFDIFAKAGYSHINIPHLQFNKTFFNQVYEVYRFSGTAKDWQFGWNAGTRLVYNLKPWIGLQARADFFTTKYMSDVAYDNNYRKAVDANRNGIMEDSEYFESQKMSSSSTTDLSVVNVNMGLVFSLGKKRVAPVTQMVPDMGNNQEIKAETIKPETEKPVTESTLEPTDQTQKSEPPVSEEKVPVANLDEAPGKVAEPEAGHQVADKDIKAEDAKATEISAKKEEIPAELPVTTYDAPEARYDEQAAEHLYSAGEAYFADNDFENAIPCFNKLKADPKYPRARYMFALSLCSTGNCDEAKKEYREFARSYKEADARTLEIIFASHFEKCAMSGKKTTSGPKTTDTTTGKAVTTSSATNVSTDGADADSGTEYKVQFIALRKSDKQFPKVAEMGLIGTEFFIDRTVYRYSLGGYTDMASAVKDVVRVRRMGFRDAFIAVYKNGVRVNTLYHAR